MNDERRKLLHTRVNETLYYFWDPIGVNDAPEARDEYDSYVAGIVEMLLKDATEDEVAKHLLSLETGPMSLPTNNSQHRSEVAERLVHWKQGILESDS